MATSGNFKQYQKPWGDKMYSKSRTYSYAGCAPTSIANIVYAWNKKILPTTVGSWIRSQGLVKADGRTYITAITKAFAHFGGKATNYNTPMTLFRKLYDDKSKGIDSYAIMDMGAGTHNDITWTKGGHFVAVTDVRKHGSNDFELYVKDCGARNNTGWFSYRKHMQGSIKYCWLVTSDKLNKSTKTSTATSKPATAPIKKPETSTKGNDVKVAHSNSSGSQSCKLRGWYDSKSKPAIFVMRPKDEAIAKKIAEQAVKATKNKHILYAKDHKRHKGKELALALSKVNWDMSAVADTAYTVCTDFQMCCVLSAMPEVRKGISDYAEWAWASHRGLESKLSRTGRFLKLTDSDMLRKGVGLKVGDLICYANKTADHGVVVVEV